MKHKRHAQPLERFRYFQIRHLKKRLEEILADFERLDEGEKPDIESGINLQQEIQKFERDMIQCALKFTGGHQRRAALLLQLNPTTLNAKMKGYGISWSPLVNAESKTRKDEPVGDIDETR